MAQPTKTEAQQPPPPRPPEVAAAPAQPPKPPAKYFAPVGSVQDFEFAHRWKAVRVPAGTPATAVTAFDYLKHHLASIGDGDLIIFEWEDGTREVWCRVLYKSPTGLKLSKLIDVEHESVSIVPDDAFKIDFMGMVRKWCVIRADDNFVLKDGLPSKSDATAFLANYMKSMR